MTTRAAKRPSGEPSSLDRRWAVSEDIWADPLDDTPPRWVTDDLPQFGPDASKGVPLLDDEPVVDPTPRSFATALVDEVLLSRAADLHPGGERLKHYWTRDPEGLAKWATHPHPWTALRNHLVKFVGPERADRIASQWFKIVFGIWPGERKGDNPVGPG